MTDFKPGDRVICVDPSYSRYTLEKGEYYEVSKVGRNGYLSLKDSEGIEYFDWAPHRFKLVEKTIPDYSEVETMDDPPVSPGQEAISREGKALIDLLLRKNQDYGNSAMTSPILAPNMTAREAIQCRMSDKIRRLERLLAGNQATVNESVEDSIRDLCGYCILWLATKD